MIYFNRPEIYALLAAVANGTIGPLNRFAFNAGAGYQEVAFIKCFGSFIVLLFYCSLKSNLRSDLVALKSRCFIYIILSFLGVFCLYFFETWAFKEASIPVVSFLVYASGIFTIVLSVFFLKESVTKLKIFAFISIIIGVFIIILSKDILSGTFFGMLLALMAGLGYSLFIFFTKFFNVTSSLASLVWLFGFGSVFLSIPIIFSNEFNFPLVAIFPTIGLIAIPTIAGFWFTIKAVSKGSASSVQIIETTDPLFATLFAIILFNEIITNTVWLGAFFIVCGLLISLKRIEDKTYYESTKNKSRILPRGEA
jgi:drug/metabolite transporter (DMT)-like permease